MINHLSNKTNNLRLHHLLKIKIQGMIRMRRKIKRMTIKRMSNSRNKYLKNSSLTQKEGWLMRNFSSLHNKHRDAEGRLGEQRM